MNPCRFAFVVISAADRFTNSVHKRNWHCVLFLCVFSVGRKYITKKNSNSIKIGRTSFKINLDLRIMSLVEYRDGLTNAVRT